MSQTTEPPSCSAGVPQAVREYCRRHLSAARYAHLERVLQTMQELAQQKGGPPEPALSLAGLGHDIARELPGELAQLLARSSGRPLQDWERENPLLCHNKAGVCILQQCFGVHDPEVLQAVEHHTLGAAGLGQLAKLLYAADFLEPGRRFLNPEEREGYLALELDTMVYRICRHSSKFLQQSGKPILPPTLAMLGELEQQLAIPMQQRFFVA